MEDTREDARDVKELERLDNDDNNKISPEISEEIPSESSSKNTQNTDITNCLALTIQKDYKLLVAKNVFFHSIKMSWKVIVSTVFLTLIKFLA